MDLFCFIDKNLSIALLQSEYTTKSINIIGIIDKYLIKSI